MRKALFVAAIVLIQCISAFAQSPDKLEGRWAGTVEGFQGKQNAVAAFKKDGDKYTGSISGLRPGSDAAPLKEHQDRWRQGDREDRSRNAARKRHNQLRVRRAGRQLEGKRRG